MRSSRRCDGDPFDHPSIVRWLALVFACLTAGTAAQAGRIRLHKPRRGFQMRMEPFTVAPGADREGCEVATTPNDRPMDVAAFELKTTPGTHHFVVWNYLGDDRNPADFWNGIAYVPGCTGLGPQSGANNANLFGMLSGRSRFEFPAGIAVRLEPHAIVYPNLHFHNYSEKSVLGQAVFNFVPARKGTVRHHAQAFTVGSFQIDIPARGSAALTGEWHTNTALNLVQVSTHQHHRGTGVTVNKIDAAGNDLGLLVSTSNWEHPAVRWFDEGTQRLEAGQGLRFSCAWQNPDDHPVHFGTTTEDEMCFATGYFYPDEDGATLTQPGCIPQGAGLECFVAKLP
jgi:hypothetical protein